jgi:hypothetical protein
MEKFIVIDVVELSITPSTINGTLPANLSGLLVVSIVLLLVVPVAAVFTPITINVYSTLLCEAVVSRTILLSLVSRTALLTASAVTPALIE